MNYCNSVLVYFTPAQMTFLKTCVKNSKVKTSFVRELRACVNHRMGKPLYFGESIRADEERDVLRQKILNYFARCFDAPAKLEIWEGTVSSIYDALDLKTEMTWEKAKKLIRSFLTHLANHCFETVQQKSFQGRGKLMTWAVHRDFLTEYKKESLA